MGGRGKKRLWSPTVESHKDLANNINIKVLMTYMADAPTKIIPPTHQDNNAIFYSGNTGNFIQSTSVCMNQ